MKNLLLLLLSASALFAGDSPKQSGRIGETLEQFAARYGPATKLDDRHSSFEKDGFHITVTVEQGKVSGITYYKIAADLTAAEIKILLGHSGLDWKKLDSGLFASGDYRAVHIPHTLAIEKVAPAPEDTEAAAKARLKGI